MFPHRIRVKGVKKRIGKMVTGTSLLVIAYIDVGRGLAVVSVFTFLPFYPKAFAAAGMLNGCAGI